MFLFEDDNLVVWSWSIKSNHFFLLWCSLNIIIVLVVISQYYENQFSILKQQKSWYWNKYVGGKFIRFFADGDWMNSATVICWTICHFCSFVGDLSLAIKNMQMLWVCNWLLLLRIYFYFKVLDYVYLLLVLG